ncbi:MAG: NAD-dependent epimerase/dehydratase family protein [Candidatus Riflebacteria bacterium]|nr:NAD-dependent epimerase/dehydratase family protein [Candidatus Riflebacteria bacterium]
MEPVVVIGSNSFSGAHFCAHAMRQGARVVGISRSDPPPDAFLPYREVGTGSFTFHRLDLNHDLEAIMRVIDEARPARVVNFAAQSMVGESWQHPEHWYQTNVVSTIRLHDRLRTRPFLQTYLHVSTPEVYGSCSGLVAEHTVYHPSTPYAISRAAADLSLMAFFQTYRFPVVFTRAANVFGPGQQLYRVIPRAILSILLGKRLPLHGGGHSTRSFIHIGDVVRGTWEAATRGRPGEIYHLSTPRHVTIRELVGLIADRLQVRFEDVVEIVGDRPGKDAAYLLDSAKARRELDWEPKITLEEGLDETIAWVRRHFDVLKAMPLDYQHKP